MQKKYPAIKSFYNQKDAVLGAFPRSYLHLPLEKLHSNGDDSPPEEAGVIPI